MEKKKEKVLDIFLLLVILIACICVLTFKIGDENRFIKKIDGIHKFEATTTEKNIDYNHQKYKLLLKKVNCNLKNVNNYSNLIDNYALIKGKNTYTFKVSEKLFNTEIEDKSAVIKLDSMIIEDKKNNKKYDLTKIINDNFLYSYFSGLKEGNYSYNGVGIFKYKKDLFLELAPYSDNYWVNKSKLNGYGNINDVQAVLKAQNEMIFINMDKQKVYKVSDINKIRKVKNPYSQVLNKNNIYYKYCGVDNNTNNNTYQLKMDSLDNDKAESIFNRNGYKNYDEIAVEINKDNFKGAIELMTGIKDISFKGIVIDKKYSIDNKKHIINTEAEFKRYMK